jgi:hypothetical protein
MRLTKSAAKLVARASTSKYFNANRAAIYARRAKRAKRKQTASEAVQKEPSAGT